MTIPTEFKDLFDKKALADVATIGPDGEPHVSPVWIDFDGQYVKFSQTTKRQKYKNLKRDSRIALSIVDPDDPYRYVEIRGIAEKIEVDDNNAFIDSMTKKYVGKDEYPWHQPGDQRVVVFVRPEHVPNR